MQTSHVRKAIRAAMSTASALDLAVDDAIVLNDSNRLVLRLMPCDIVARVATTAHHIWAGYLSPETAVELAQRLAEIDSPVAALERRVEPRVYVRDGFVIDLWTYYEHVPAREVAPADYAHALEGLHAGMRQIDVTTPHFTDRVEDTREWLASDTPELADEDRELLDSTLRSLSRAIGDRGIAEQLLHGEPHPWNVLGTRNGPLFIDFENSCRGPVEYDLAWVPEEVSERYPGADQELVADCRGLMLAIVTACHWRRDDQHPGNKGRAEWLNVIRQGPPWPALDVV